MNDKAKFIIYSICTLLNLAVWLGVVIKSFFFLYKTFLYLTFISFTLSTFYLMIMFIVEAEKFWHRRNESRIERIQKRRYYVTLRDRLFKIVFTLSLTVCFCYWLLLLGGDTIMMWQSRAFDIAITVYVHCLIGLMILFELFLTDRNHYDEHFYKDWLILSAVYIVYTVVLTTVCKVTSVKIYKFLELEMKQIIVLNIIMYILCFNIYMLYFKIMNIKINRRKNSIQNFENDLLPPNYTNVDESPLYIKSTGTDFGNAQPLNIIISPEN